ncbi:hypothetical protein SMACR_02853 [Sordaria macrospora]|uniref:WGS project CABT00000000 data, contig 2.12 n=2 Tax=Sordaria macrospora TaxID=5147 RepID=F7VXN2_SORMK|nr:uncharacterized protein SMAC_02853 [Sordaria macrospora k-hell]KAA8632824.1 hypothetical protein SMACR_02853 [Sordaria macrospora]WPJ58207.1 hypothetical protein SMAC4_02853 [Sordaria macrospora]CCC10276.1 unnamed protein product [Sordaria macrospora k-hell]
MERPSKRPRTGPAPFDDEEVVGDELNHQPEEVNQLRDPGYQLEKARSYAAFKLKSAFENIFEKYGKDFDGIGDEIDLRTGEIVVDNGHIKSLKTNTIGVENDDDDDDESGSESGTEEETIIPGQEIKQNATALQTVPRPLPSITPPSPFGALGPGYNSFGGSPSAFGGFGLGYNSFPGGPHQMPNMMYPGQAQFRLFPMPSGAFSSANASIDPAWRAPDLPPPVSWGGFWTPGIQTRVKTVAKVQQLIAGTNHAEEGEDEDDILLDVSTTVITKATENGPVITKKLAPFRPPSTVSSPANHQLKKPAATSTPKSVGKPDAVNTSGEKKKPPKRKTPAKKTPAKTNPVEEWITGRVEATDIHAGASPVVDGPSADTQPVIEPEPAVEQMPVAEKPVGSNNEEVKRKRTPNRKTPTSDKSSAQNANVSRENHVKSAPVPMAEEYVTAAESETQPIVEYEPRIEDWSDKPSVDKSGVEAALVKDPAVGTHKRTSKRKTPTRRASTREQDCQGSSTNPSVNNSNQSALAPPVEQLLVGAQLVEIQSSLTTQSVSEQPSVQETTVKEPVVEKTSIDEGPVAESEPPSAGGDEDQFTSVSAAVTKPVNHGLPQIPNSTDSRTTRMRRRLSVRDQPSPVGAKGSRGEQLASRYERPLFNGESNANTTLPLQYYSPSRGALITKPSNQKLWVEIPVDGTLDPKAFQVVVDDDTLISEVPALEEGTETMATEELTWDDVAKPQFLRGPETQTEVVEEQSPPTSDAPQEVFTRNVVDSAYAFSDEDEPAIPKTKVQRVELREPDPKSKPVENPSVTKFGIPTPSSSFDRGDQTIGSEATSQTEIPVEELPVISTAMTTETAQQTQTTGSVLLDKTNTNSEGLHSLPEPVQVTKPKRGRPARKPKTPLDLGDTISPGVTSKPAVAENSSEPSPFATALASILPRRQSLRLSRGRRDSDVTIAESTTPQHATATAFQHGDQSVIIQESPQRTPEPELEPEDEAGGPASPTLSATIPASPKLSENSALDQELPENSLLEEAIARQRFWSPKPESIILGHEPSPPEPRAITILEVQIPSRQMSQVEKVMDIVTLSEPIPPTSPSPPPQEQESIIIEDIQPQQQPEQPTTPLKAKPRRGRSPSAASLPTATITTVTKVKIKSGLGPGSGSGPRSSRKTTRTPSTTTTTTTRTPAAVPIAFSSKWTLPLKQQSQSQAQTPGTSKSTKSILSLISDTDDDEDELTLDFATGTPSSGTVNSIRKRGRPKKSITTAAGTTSSGVPKPQSTAKKTTTSLLSSSSLLLRTPSRIPPRKTTSLAKIASSISISVGVGRSASTPTARAVTPSAGSEAEGEEFVGSEVIQTPGGTLRRCGEAGFRCDRDFCFGCL